MRRPEEEYGVKVEAEEDVFFDEFQEEDDLLGEEEIEFVSARLPVR